MNYTLFRTNHHLPAFLRPSTSAITGKNATRKNIYKHTHCLSLDFLPQNALGEGPAFRIQHDLLIRANSISLLVQFRLGNLVLLLFQDGTFGSQDLSMQLAMDAMDQLYGHDGGNLNVLEK